MGSSSSPPDLNLRFVIGKASCVVGLLFLLIAIALCAHAQKTKVVPENPQVTNQDDNFEKHFDAARADQRRGDQELAATEYKAFLVQAVRRVANLRAHFGKYEEAQKLLEAGLSLEPGNIDLLLDFSAMRLDQEKFDDARSLAERALKSSRGNPRAEYLIGNALCQQGNYAEAKPHLEAAVVGSPNFETGYLLGLTYLKLHDPTHAEMLFKDMVAGMGDTAKLHMYLGRAYRNGGYIDRAVEELKKAAAKNPDEPQVHYFLGLAYLGRDGDSGFAEAAPEFREELHRNPNDYRSRYLLGYILLKQHDLPNAETELAQAVALDPQNPDPLIYLGQVYAETNRPQEAEKALRSAIVLTTDPSRNDYQISRAHYVLGRILFDSDRKDEGKEEMRKAAELGKRSMQLARERLAGDKPNLAGEELSRQQDQTSGTTREETQRADAYVNQLRPAIADSYNNLGVIAAGNKEFKTAFEYFLQVADWQPSLETLDRNLGMAAFYANQFDQAIQPLSRQIQKQPDDTRARTALALSFFALQKYSHVKEVLSPVQADVDAAPELNYAYAVSLLKTGDYNQGINRLRALEKVDYKSADLHALLGDAFAEQNDWAAALQEYRRAIAIDPKQAHTHFLAGLALIRQGSPGQAVGEFRTALRLDPADVSSKYHLAYSLIELDKKDEASPLLKEVIRQDPKHADAYYQLGKLQLERGDAKAAIPNLEAGTRFKPDADYIHYQLAMAYRRDSRIDDARRELKVYQELKDRHRGRTAAESN
jgi:tetratricopeptide (TPR) repeat protein